MDQVSRSRAMTEMVSAFSTSVLTTFQELAGTEVALVAPIVESTAPPVTDVYAAIELQRPTPGLLVCAFPSATLEALARRYLPSTIALTPEILNDVAGEFANVIAGQAKTMLKGTAYHYGLSTPKVVRDECSVPHCPVIGTELQFDGTAGRFWIWINIVADGPRSAGIENQPIMKATN